MQVKQADIFGNLISVGKRPVLLRDTIASSAAFAPKQHKVVYTGLKVYIRPTRLICLPQFSGGMPSRTAAQRDSESNLKNHKTNGDVSDKVKNRIGNAVNWLALSAKKKRIYHKATAKTFEYKLGLFTLTLPDTSVPVSASFFKEQLLQPWLAYARKYFALQNYVWKIEPQENNKVHVHITSDTFIHHTDLRRAWNNQLRRNGLLDDFVCKFGHDNPPTEQAVSVKSVKDMACYLAKYMVKGEAHVSDILQLDDSAADVICQRKNGDQYKRNVAHFKSIWSDCGRLWGCNYELSNASTKFIEAVAQEEYKIFDQLYTAECEQKPILGKMQSNGYYKVIGNIFYMKARTWLRDVSGELKEKFTEIITYLRDHIPPADNLFYQYSPIKYCL